MGFDEERRFFVVSRALSAIGRDDVKEKMFLCSQKNDAWPIIITISKVKHR